MPYKKGHRNVDSVADEGSEGAECASRRAAAYCERAECGPRACAGLGFFWEPGAEPAALAETQASLRFEEKVVTLSPTRLEQTLAAERLLA